MWITLVGNKPLFYMYLCIKIYKTEIIQYDLVGNFIKQFSSIKEAICELNLHKKAASHIGKCCRKQKPTAYGFKWKYRHDVETQSVNS